MDIPTVDQIRWADTPPDDTRPPSRKRTVGVTAALVLTGVLGAALAWEGRADAARLADPSCWTHTVTRGDTLSSIARNYDTTLDALIAMNPQLGSPSFNLIYPGDEVAIVCLGDARPPARAEHVDVSRWIDEREADGRLTWRSVVANLYEQGMRGEELVILAAVAECESARFPQAEGDQHLANSTWGSSWGVWQVRSLHAQAGTNGPRDAAALRSSLTHQAWAASEVWRAQGAKAWTCWRNNHHIGPMGAVRQAAAEIGVA